MNRRVMGGVLAAVLLGGLLHAGGKRIAPATAPVAEVSTPSPFYLGVGAVGAFLERDPCPCSPDGPRLEDSRYGWIVRGGWDLLPYLGVELRALQTLEDDVFSKTRHYGIYLRPNYDLGKRLNLYGLLGYGHTRIDYTNGVYSSVTTHDGVAYGAGLELDLDGKGDHYGWGLFADYSRLLSGDGPKHTDADILSAGVMYRF